MLVLVRLVKWEQEKKCLQRHSTLVMSCTATDQVGKCWLFLYIYHHCVLVLYKHNIPMSRLQ